MFQILVARGRGTDAQFAPAEIERVDLATFAWTLRNGEPMNMILPC